jgi:hypothetical protein
MIADRSAEMLSLPGIEPTELSADAGPDTTASAPGRRRILTLAAGGAALLAAGGGAALWAALRGDDDQDPTARSTGQRWVIGVHADLSGPLKAAGTAQERAARLAVEQFNSRKDKPFTLSLQSVDDRGDPARAQQAARRLTGDTDVLAVLGPTGYASAQAALEVYESAGLPVLTVSELSTHRRGVGPAGRAALVLPDRAHGPVHRLQHRHRPRRAGFSATRVCWATARAARRHGVRADGP